MHIQNDKINYNSLTHKFLIFVYKKCVVQRRSQTVILSIHRVEDCIKI